jgi:hypothetical protein
MRTMPIRDLSLRWERSICLHRTALRRAPERRPQIRFQRDSSSSRGAASQAAREIHAITLMHRQTSTSANRHINWGVRDCFVYLRLLLQTPYSPYFSWLINEFLLRIQATKKRSKDRFFSNAETHYLRSATKALRIVCGSGLIAAL